MKKLGQYLLICGLLILNIPGCSPYGTHTIDLQTEQNFSDAQRIILENQEMPWE